MDADDGWMPLYLSTLAGMSTCLGALIVFCHPLEEDDADDDCERARPTTNGPRRIVSGGRRKVSPSTMAFSLALAGSVMVTVSVVSIGPECLAASSMPENATRSSLDAANSFFIFGIQLMPIWSWEFLHRLESFAAGCFLYFLMSKYAFPEPEEILSNHLEHRSHSRTSSRASVTSEKLSDDEEGNEWDDEEGEWTDLDSSADDINPTPLQITASDLALKSPLQRRGAGDGDAAFSPISPSGGVKNRGVTRRPPAERTCCGGRLASCASSLRVFAKGSDLDTSEARRANRVAMLLFFSLLIHNFPEGLAVAASALESDQLGLTVTIGVMIHNIPEGIAIAIPCLKARPDSPWLSFVLASVSGLAEPAGAFVSLVLLRGVERRQTGGGMLEEGESIGGEGALENVLAFVAGIMITVSFLELFPEARRHAEKTGRNVYRAGLAAGFVVMIATEFGMSL